MVAISLISSACAFANTSPFLASIGGLEKFPHMIHSQSLSQLLVGTISEVCQSGNNVITIQVPGLDFENLKSGILNYLPSSDISFSPHVEYGENDKFSPYGTCFLESARIRSEKDDSWLSKVERGSGKAVVLTLPKLSSAEQREMLDSVFAKLDVLLDGALTNIMVQGVPSFEAVGQNLYNENLGGKNKRIEDGELEALEQAEQELEDAFKEIESMIDDDSEVTIMSDGSVFDNYGFFTPGIWMCTLISLFLVWILLMALKWVGSLQVSYKAFEKPVSSKKTQ